MVKSEFWYADLTFYRKYKYPWIELRELKRQIKNIIEIDKYPQVSANALTTVINLRKWI